MTDAQEEIRAAAGRAIDARLDLADVIRAHCPGPHAYVQHRDGQSPWCDACGYTERGMRVKAAQTCPTCSGPSRWTVGMVCQTCGTDYGPTP